jgi:hypothetical protein
VPEAPIAYAPWRDTEKGVGQWYVHQSLARFRSLMKGRQSGGTQCGIAEIGIDAMGNIGHIDWWIAPNYKVKDRAWRGLLAFIPPAAIKKKNETELRLILTTGSEIHVKSADAPDSLVSEGLHFAVCDEAGQWKEDAWFRGVRPMFTATGGRALLIGTPRGKNWFYRTWLMGRPGPDKDPDYESFRWASIDSPFSDEKDIAEARKNLPSDIFKQEYEADPLDNSSGVFHGVRSCIRVGAQIDPMTVIGADFARKHDFSCFIPMNSARQAIAVYRSQEDWPLQKQQVGALAMRGALSGWSSFRIVGDEAGLGDPVIQELRATGLQVEGINTNGSIKGTIIENLRLAFENSTIGIPNDDVLISELEAYEYEVLPSGHLRYSAPEGQHDDTVIALALALWGQRGSIGMFAQPNRQTTYMGASTGGSSYMQGNRGRSSWPL